MSSTALCGIPLSEPCFSRRVRRCRSKSDSLTKDEDEEDDGEGVSWRRSSRSFLREAVCATGATEEEEAEAGGSVESWPEEERN